MCDAECWSEHTRRLPPLRVGDTVRIQNQTGPNPTKWDKTGAVIEVRQFDQYLIRVDGSGRATLRNQRFLRKYTPAIPQPTRRSILEDLGTLPVIAGLGMNNPSTPQPSWSDDRNRPIEDTMEPPTTHLVTKPSELPPAIQPAASAPPSPERLPPTIPVTSPSHTDDTASVPNRDIDQTPRRSTRARRLPTWMDDYSA